MSLRVVEVALRPPYAVRIGPGALFELGAVLEHAGLRPGAVVSDPLVAELHGARLGPLSRLPLFLAPRGEAGKRLAVLESALEFLAASALDRGACLVTLGGGAVCDLGGLAAALFMRGIDVVHAPTTLLAQVDAAVGGKTAVNLAAGKNLAGTVHQPRAVVCDTAVLATLPAVELAAGLGEVVKTALLGGERELALVEARAPELAAGSAAALAEVTAACVAVKAGLVAADEHERGRRKELNLGHTFAHGIEHAAGYGRVPHGQAVAVGVVLALACARELGRLEDSALPERVARLLRVLGLPVTPSELAAAFDAPLAPEAVLAAMARDKKGRAGEPALVLPRAAGRVDVDVRPGRAFCAELLARALRV